MKDSNLDYDEILENIYDLENNNVPKNSNSEDIFENFDDYGSENSMIFSDSTSLNEDNHRIIHKPTNENDKFLNNQKVQDINSREFKSFEKDDFSSFDNGRKSLVYDDFSSFDNGEKSDNSKKGRNKKLAIALVIIILIIAICGLFIVNNSQMLANNGNINIFKSDVSTDDSNINVTLDNVNFVLPAGSNIKNQSSFDVSFDYKNSHCSLMEIGADSISGIVDDSDGRGYYTTRLSSSSDKIFDIYSFTESSSDISGYFALLVKDDKYFVLYSYQSGIPADGNVNSELKEVIDLFNKLN